MTLRELINQARSRLDDTRPPYLWSDLELVQWFNDCQNELCEKIGLIRDTTTTAICNISTISGTAIYSLDSRVVKLISVKYGSTYRVLVPTYRTILNDDRPGWEVDTGIPNWYFMEDTYKIHLYPNPTENSTLYLSVTRYPLNQLVITTDTASPEIPWQYHSKLVEGVLSLAYRKHDSETLNPKDAMMHEMAWQKYINEITQNEINYYDFGRVLSPFYGNI